MQRIPAMGDEIMYLCISCMNEIPEENKEKCPCCGFSRSSYQPGSGLLLPESIFEERYYIGRGYNGDSSGISYIVYDTVMNRRAVLRQLFSSGAPWEGGSPDKYSDFQHRHAFIDSYQHLAGVKLSSQPKVYTCREDTDRVYAVTQYISQKTLADEIASGGAKDYKDAKNLLLPVLTSLNVLHSFRIAHGSLNPHTIFMSENTPVVCDISGNALDEKSSAYDVRHFLQIFLSVMCGSPEMIHMKNMPRSFFENNTLGLPDEVLKIMCGIMDGEAPYPGVGDVFRAVYGTDAGLPEIKTTRNSQKPPPKYLFDLAAKRGVAVTRLITSLE